jgi:hypothetical protein
MRWDAIPTDPPELKSDAAAPSGWVKAYLQGRECPAALHRGAGVQHLARTGFSGALVVAVALGALFGAAQPAGADGYAINSVSVSLSSNQAGAHADLTTTISLATDGAGHPSAATRDLSVAFPAGVIGDVASAPRCSMVQLGDKTTNSACPLGSQVGVIHVSLAGALNSEITSPVYNLAPGTGGGEVARMGFFAPSLPVLIKFRLDPDRFGLIASIEGASSAAILSGAALTLWGVPAAPQHDPERLTPLEAATGEGPAGGRSAAEPETPFLTNPVSCSPREVSATATSYSAAASPSTKTVPFPTISGCGRLDFPAALSACPTASVPGVPSGLELKLTISQSRAPAALATAVLGSGELALPAGLSINPAVADGLLACGADQVRLGRSGPPRCPDGSKIGAILVQIPAIGGSVAGSVYQRTPEPGNPFGLWLTTEERGVYLKLAARLEPDPDTGRLRVLLGAGDPLPELPISELDLRLFAGPRAALLTPASCGSYLSHYSLTPSSGALPSENQAAFALSGACSEPIASPRLWAGSGISSAGRATPFTITLATGEGGAEVRSLDALLPPGLLALLPEVPLCDRPEAGLCPAQSRIGSAAIAIGSPAASLWIPQGGQPAPAIYLAGPYRGAPYSLAIAIPARAGPYDLGTVVLRAAVELDPGSARMRIATDPLPGILAGVPLSYRTLSLSFDRPGFLVNPTSCAPSATEAALTANGAPELLLSAGFQATGCANLGLRPRFALRLSGLARNAHPALRLDLTPRSADSNLAAASFTLPDGELLDTRHIRTLCPRTVVPERCPSASRLGWARLWSPTVEGPFEGPVYLRTAGHRLPGLLADLRHGDLRFGLGGSTSSRQGRLRVSFSELPDIPISRALLTLPGGSRGIFVNSASLCAPTTEVSASFAAHNGRHRALRSRPRLEGSC